MTINWDLFSPVPAAIGGAMIGLACALFILLNGRIAGISGIIGGLFQGKQGNVAWRVAFLLGLLVAPVAYAIIGRMPEIHVETGYSTLIVAGVLVGLGTRYGSGCTSGHGVCGLSRLSLRSLAATLSFMLAGFATVFVVRHILGNA